MSAILVVNTEPEAIRLLPWALKFASSDDRELQVIIAQQKDGKTEWRKVELDSDQTEEVPDLQATIRRLAKLDESNGIDSVTENGHVSDVSVRRLRARQPDTEILSACSSCRLMVLALNEPVRDGNKSWMSRLFRTAPCEAIYLRVPPDSKPDIRRILVPTDGDANANAALRRAELLVGPRTDPDESPITALYVEPELDIVSRDAGNRRLDRIVRRAVGNNDIRKKVVVSDKVMDGFHQAMKDEYDLVMVGGYWDRTIKQFYFEKVSNQHFSGTDAPAFAAVRAGVPFRTRFQQFCERRVQRYVPQLDREDRVSLVDRVRGSSQWNFDFIALICLSTAIAAMGLVRNQAAVVIGAMLVAPLMTPLIGAGLAVVQGNSRLVRNALRTVLGGFLLALGIGFCIGLLHRSDEFTHEIIGRTSPHPVDLAVALFGGIAAAYAMSRPNLSSALPGVAIAAALVPPIAAAGITLSHGAWAFALGAILLFLTNIVAIVMGTSFSLWMVGVRDTHQHGTKQTWTSWFVAFLLVVTIALAFRISTWAVATDRVVLDQLEQQIERVVNDSNCGATLAEFRKLNDTSMLVIVEAPDDEIGTLPEDLRQLAEEHFNSEDALVKLEVRHVVSAGGKTERPPAE